MSVTRAVLQYGNTPDRYTGLSPAYMLLGRQLKDYLPSTNSHQLSISRTCPAPCKWREAALSKRSAKDQEKLSSQVKEHSPLSFGDHVMVQNQEGDNPNVEQTRWSHDAWVTKLQSACPANGTLDDLLEWAIPTQVQASCNTEEPQSNVGAGQNNN